MERMSRLSSACRSLITLAQRGSDESLRTRFRARQLRDDASFAHHEDAVTELRDLFGLTRVVKECLPFCGEVDDELVDVVFRPYVDAARNVEQEKHVRFGEQPSPDQDFLLIAP